MGVCQASQSTVSAFSTVLQVSTDAKQVLENSFLHLFEGRHVPGNSELLSFVFLPNYAD